jgi:hypothetical protein
LRTFAIASAHRGETAPMDVGGTSGRGPSAGGGSGGGATADGVAFRAGSTVSTVSTGAGDGAGDGKAERVGADAGVDAGAGGKGSGFAGAQDVASMMGATSKKPLESRMCRSMFAPGGPRGKGNPPL